VDSLSGGNEETVPTLSGVVPDAGALCVLCVCVCVCALTVYCVPLQEGAGAEVALPTRRALFMQVRCVCAVCVYVYQVCTDCVLCSIAGGMSWPGGRGRH